MTMTPKVSQKMTLPSLMVVINIRQEETPILSLSYLIFVD